MIVRLGLVAFAAVALGMFASPVAAQPVPPDQLAQAQRQEPAPPPFPPMPRARPSHRFVDVGQHRTTSTHRKTTRARHSSGSEHHRATTGHRHGKTRVTHYLTRTERDLRYCHQLTHRNQMRNSRCKLLLRDEKRAAEHRKQVEQARRLRVCHRLTHRQLKRSPRCQTLLREERRAAEHRREHKRHRAHHRR